MLACVCVCVCVCMTICNCVCMCVCVFVCMHACDDVGVGVHVYACLCGEKQSERRTMTDKQKQTPQSISFSKATDCKHFQTLLITLQNITMVHVISQKHTSIAHEPRWHKGQNKITFMSLETIWSSKVFLLDFYSDTYFYLFVLVLVFVKMHVTVPIPGNVLSNLSQNLNILNYNITHRI